MELEGVAVPVLQLKVKVAKKCQTILTKLSNIVPGWLIGMMSQK